MTTWTYHPCPKCGATDRVCEVDGGCRPEDIAYRESYEAWTQHLDESEGETGRYKVQIRLGPNGAHVAYRRAANLKTARALCLRVPPLGVAGIWRPDRTIHAWYSRDAEGKLTIT